MERLIGIFYKYGVSTFCVKDESIQQKRKCGIVIATMTTNPT